MGKRVGFWFYTGDWMKDPELRFCSIFARGLLVDLLCLMFEAKRQGELSKPDGSPRSDEEIVDCVSGSDRATKLAALKELINSGALKRDENTGVLYSSRLREIAGITNARSKSGSKGGANTQAKLKQTVKQTLKQSEQQNRGVTVTVSDSVSVSDTDTSIHSHQEEEVSVSIEEALETLQIDSNPEVSEPLLTPVINNIAPDLGKAFRRWLCFRHAIDGQWMPAIRQELVLMDLVRVGNIPKAISDLEFSIRLGAKNILDSNRNFQKPDQEALRSYGQRIAEATGI